jgi:hypothetical protein
MRHVSNELGGHNSRRSQRLFGNPDYLIRLVCRRCARLPAALRRRGSASRPDFAIFPSAIVIKQAAGPESCQSLHAVAVAQAISAALPSELIRHDPSVQKSRSI